MPENGQWIPEMDRGGTSARTLPDMSLARFLRFVSLAYSIIDTVSVKTAATEGAA